MIFVLRSLPAPLTLHSCSGRQLKKNLEKAWKFSKSQKLVLDAMTAALDQKSVKTWKGMIDTYYREPSCAFNPFEEPPRSRFFH